MNLEMQKIKGFNCPNKYIILNNKIMILVANSKRQATSVIQYLLGSKLTDLPLEQTNFLNRVMKHHNFKLPVDKR